MELKLVVGDINHVLPNFIPSTFNTCIKSSEHFIIIVCFLNSTITIMCPSISFKTTKASDDLVYECLSTKCSGLSEPNICVECSLIPTIDSPMHHCDKDTLFRSCLLYKLPFIRLHAYTY